MTTQNKNKNKKESIKVKTKNNSKIMIQIIKDNPCRAYKKFKIITMIVRKI